MGLSGLEGLMAGIADLWFGVVVPGGGIRSSCFFLVSVFSNGVTAVPMFCAIQGLVT